MCVCVCVLRIYWKCYILTLDWAVNQGMHLCKWAEEQRKQVCVKQKYNQDTDGMGQLQLELESVGGQDASVRIILQTEGLRPPVTHGWVTPAKIRKRCCYGQKNFGSICSSLFPSPTHLSHTTNIKPFENKVWEIYFYKEVCSFVHWSRHYCWLCFRLYLYMYIYTAIQQKGIEYLPNIPSRT